MGAYRPGKSITRIGDLRAGDLVFRVGQPFRQDGLMRVERVGNDMTDDVAYGYCVDPHHPEQPLHPHTARDPIWRADIQSKRFFWAIKDT